MKIVLATGIYPPESGGPATYTAALFQAFKTRGHTVTVVAYGEGESEGVFRVSRRGGPLLRYLRFAWRVFRLARNADLVYAQGPVSEGLPATIGAKLAGRPVIMKVVGDYAWEMAQQRNGRAQHAVPLLDAFLKKEPNDLLSRIERWTARRAQRVIVPSQYLKTVVERWGIPPERISVVINASEPLPKTRGRDEERKALDVEDTTVILTVARAVPWKGIGELVSWWKDLPKTHLLVVAGDGPSLEGWKKLAEQEGVAGRIRFVGRVDREMVARWYAATDAFVLHSGYEGYSHVVAEAASVGLPCFVSDQGGNPETKELFGDLVTVLPYQQKTPWVEALSSVGAHGNAHAPEGAKWTHEHMIDATEKILMGNDHVMQVVMVSYDRDLLDPSSSAFQRVRSLATETLSINIVVLRGRFFRSILEGIRLAKRFPARTVVTAQDPFAAGLVGFFISRWTNVPLEIQEHGDFYSGFWVRESLKNCILSLIGYVILRRAEGVRAVSERVKEHLIRRGIFAGKIDVMPVAQDLAPLFDRRHRKMSAVPTILAPCRFVSQKGLDVLLGAAKILNKQGVKFSLHIVGSGPLQAELVRKIKNEGLKDVVKLDAWRDPSSLWEDADLFVLSSRYEGWGRTIVEAMAAGVPIVTTDVGCVGSFFRPQVDGRVVQPNEAVGLAKAIEEQISEPERREWMCVQARERAKEFPSQDELHEQQRKGWYQVRTRYVPGTTVGPRFDLWVLAFLGFVVLTRILSVVLFHDSLANREWGFYHLVDHWFQGYGYSFARELGCASAYRSPGFLFFLTGLYSVFSPDNTLAQAIVQNLFVVGVLWLVYAIGKRLVGKRAALVGGFLMAAYPYTFYHYTQYYHTFLSSFFMLLVVWFVLKLSETKLWRHAVGAGISIGCLAYIQGTILPATPLIVLWLFWTWKWDWKRTFKAALIMGILAAGLIAPWTYRNWKQLDAFVPLTTDLGFGLFKANNEVIYELTKRGYPQEVVDDIVASSTDPRYVQYHLRPEIQEELERDGVFRDSIYWTMWHPKEPVFAVDRCSERGIFTEITENAYWKDHAVTWIGKNWKEEGWKLSLLKIKTFWQPRLFPSVKTGAAWSFADSPVKVWLARNGMAVASAIVIFGGLIGMAIALRRRDKKVFLIISILVVYTLLHSFFAGYTKYRIPLDNLLAVYAGLALVTLWDMLRGIPPKT